MPGAGVNPAVKSISAFFPCYNDAATIGDVVGTTYATLQRLGVEHEVIVIDDGSADASRDVLRQLAAERFPGLRVVAHEANRGYGGALLSGFAAATMEWVFYTDGDGQFDPRQLERMVAAATDDVDVVQGFKIRRADGVARAVIGRTYHRLVALLFDLRIRDTDCDFRLMRRSMLDLAAPERESGAICVELVRKLQDVGARFVEVPIAHRPRQSGRSQFFRPAHLAATLREIVVLWYRLVLRSRLTRRRRAAAAVASSASRQVP